jgi:membrane-bound lytic murein transglycosylase B
LPSSVRNYAVDFDGDGQIDLLNSPKDAIGSVARYMQMHGWEAGAPVAVRRQHGTDANLVPLLANDINPNFDAATLASHGVKGRQTATTGRQSGLHRTGHARRRQRILAGLPELLRDHPLQPQQLLRHVGVPAG